MILDVVELAGGAAIGDGVLEDQFTVIHICQAPVSAHGPIAKTLDLFIGAGCCLVWLILGNWSGEGAVAIFVIVSQILAGFAAIHGSRRTEAGLQARNEILGLRKYLSTITLGELQRILENNPDYYFAMAPYAMALGVDRAFARQFGDQPLSACPYLQINGGATLSARQWNERLRQVLKVLDSRQRKLVWEKLFTKK